MGVAQPDRRPRFKAFRATNFGSEARFVKNGVQALDKIASDKNRRLGGDRPEGIFSVKFELKMEAQT